MDLMQEATTGHGKRARPMGNPGDAGDDDMILPAAQSAALLAWYDIHARDLPWRVHLNRQGPDGTARATGHSLADPYRIWLSEVMLQQTTVAAVKSYFARFTSLWPDVAALAAADDDTVMAEWAGLGYYARARNLLKCARVVAQDHGGIFPDTIEGLRALPGIGPYTAAAISAIAFDRRAVVVDGNVERVMARLHAVLTPLPAAKPELTALADQLTPDARPGDYAQAVMDLGATICTPRNPACAICPWVASCHGRDQGIAASLPRKTPKAAKPVRTGIAYICCSHNGDWLLERRPPKGLLGGTLGWPGTSWTEVDNVQLDKAQLDKVQLDKAQLDKAQLDKAQLDKAQLNKIQVDKVQVDKAQDQTKNPPPIAADWVDPGLEARHTFTHFHLRLALQIARPSDAAVAHIPVLGSAMDNGQPGLLRLPADVFRASDLPTLMRKAFDLAHGAIET